jgi:hypothetical protein
VKPEILFTLKDILIKLHAEVLPGIVHEDLYGALKECIYYFETTYDRNDKHYASVLDGLYQIKKIRNDFAHARKSFTREEELKQYLVIKGFINSIQETGYLGCELSTVADILIKLDALCGEIGNELYYHPTKEEKGQRNNSFIKELLATAIVKLNHYGCLLYNISSCLEYEESVISKEIDNYLVTSIEEARSSIEGLENNDENAKESENALYFDITVTCDYIESWLIEVIDKLNSNRRAGRIEDSPQINDRDDANRKKREELIKLREKILAETGLPREYSILRKSVLEKLLKYNVNTYEKYAIYIEDLVPKYKAKQEKYLSEIFSIIDGK